MLAHLVRLSMRKGKRGDRERGRSRSGDRRSRRRDSRCRCDASDHSRRFPAEREQFSRPRNKWAADPLPYRALAGGLERQFKPSFRYWYEPGRSAEAGPVTRNDFGNSERRRIRYDERFSARAGIGQSRLRRRN